MAGADGIIFVLFKLNQIQGIQVFLLFVNENGGAYYLFSALGPSKKESASVSLMRYKLAEPGFDILKIDSSATTTLLLGCGRF